MDCLFFNDECMLPWKKIECIISCSDINYVIRSNLNVEHKQIKCLIPFRSVRNLIYRYTIKKIMFGSGLCVIAEGYRPLWLNKMVRCNNKSLFFGEMVNAGIIDYGHLLGLDGIIMEYNDVAIAYGLEPNNRDFVKFIKLRSASYQLCRKNKLTMLYLLT